MAKRKAPQQSSLVKNNLELIPIKPLTENQSKFFEAYKDYDHHMLLGSAGTGKTFLAIAKALEALNEGKVNKIVLFRSPIATFEIGALPGTIEEKTAPYESAYRSAVNTLLHRDDAYDLLKKLGVIEFSSGAFERGNTYNNCFIVIDEIQNFNGHALDTLITRIGKNTLTVLCGDLFQQDLTKVKDKNVGKMLHVLQNLPSFHTTEFGLEDIVRSGVVKEYLITKHKLYPEGY